MLSFMDTTPAPWHVVVDFVGVDLDDDEVLDALLTDPADPIMWTSGDGLVTAHGLIDAATADEAFDLVIETALAACPEARIVRVVDPLVTIGDIAAQADVSRQAVRNWALGIRHSGFPLPLDVVGDGVRVWRRADVDAWLDEALNLGSGHRYPSALAVARRNERLLRGDVGADADDPEIVEHGEDLDTGEGWTDAYVLTDTQSETVERRAAVDDPRPLRRATLPR